MLNPLTAGDRHLDVGQTLARDRCKIPRPLPQEYVIEVIVRIVQWDATGFAFDTVANKHVVAGNHAEEGAAAPA
jgi:hypothetical protein